MLWVDQVYLSLECLSLPMCLYHQNVWGQSGVSPDRMPGSSRCLFSQNASGGPDVCLQNAWESPGVSIIRNLGVSQDSLPLECLGLVRCLYFQNGGVGHKPLLLESPGWARCLYPQNAFGHTGFSIIRMSGVVQKTLPLERLGLARCLYLQNA